MEKLIRFFKNPLKRELAFMVLFGFIFAFFYWFMADAERVERYYSQWVFPFFAHTGQFIWRIVPFSVGDWFYLLLICAAMLFLFFIVRALVRKRIDRAIIWFLRSLNITFALLFVFYLFWAGNYFRLPLSIRLGYGDGPIEALPQLALWLIDKANEERAHLVEGDFKVQKRAVFAHAETLMKQQKIDTALYSAYPKLKQPLSNGFTSLMTVSGYFNPFSQEAHVNTGIPVYTLPFTSCHELAHQAGIGFEDEANFIAFLLAKGSTSPLFRYSAYYSSLFPVLKDLYLQDTLAHGKAVDRLSPQVREDIANEMAYWAGYRGYIDSVSSIFYDSYLQANNQPEGLDRYNAMVSLLLSWYSRNKTYL